MDGLSSPILLVFLLGFFFISFLAAFIILITGLLRLKKRPLNATVLIITACICLTVALIVGIGICGPFWRK
jgi:hypothetical protein